MKLNFKLCSKKSLKFTCISWQPADLVKCLLWCQGEINTLVEIESVSNFIVASTKTFLLLI